jgi:hypothetical protein
MSKVAIFNEWKVVVNNDKSISVFNNGVLCDNSSAALKQISNEMGFKYKDSWNTRQHGKNVVDEINKRKKKGGCLKKLIRFFFIFMLLAAILAVFGVVMASK